MSSLAVQCNLRMRAAHSHLSCYNAMRSSTVLLTSNIVQIDRLLVQSSSLIFANSWRDGSREAGEGGMNGATLSHNGSDVCLALSSLYHRSTPCEDGNSHRKSIDIENAPWMKSPPAPRKLTTQFNVHSTEHITVSSAFMPGVYSLLHCLYLWDDSSLVYHWLVNWAHLDDAFIYAMFEGPVVVLLVLRR